MCLKIVVHVYRSDHIFVVIISSCSVLIAKYLEDLFIRNVSMGYCLVNVVNLCTCLIGDESKDRIKNVS